MSKLLNKLANKIFLCLIFLFLVILLTSCKQKENKNKKEPEDQNFPQLENLNSGEQIAIMSTTMGNIKIRFFPEYAPKAVENFITHAKNGYYNNIIFHRVIKDFMVQSGDPLGNGTGGESIWGEDFENETSDKLFHIRGALSMANAGADTNGSQFFIVQNKKLDSNQDLSDKPEKIRDYYNKNGGCPFLDGGYSVFGQVFDGMDIVDKIANTKTDSLDKPIKDIKIKEIKIQEYQPDKK